MRVLMQSKTLELTAALREFVNRQATKLLKHSSRVQNITLFVETVGRKKNDVQASVARMVVNVPGKDIVIERRASDLYEAIVEVTRRANRHLQKVKEKRYNHKRFHKLNFAYQSEY